MTSEFTIKEVLGTLIGKTVRETTPYVYGLIDTHNGKLYIGCRTAKGCHPVELGVRYFTSSKVVAPLFRANPERFQKRILYIGEEASKQEVEFLKLMNAKDSEKFYNIKNGDEDFNAKKAAELTVILGIGVHARSKEQMSVDGKKAAQTHKLNNSGLYNKEFQAKTLATQKLLGVGIYNMSLEHRSRGGITSGNAAKENKTGIHAFTKEQYSEAAKKAHLTRFKCAECNLEGSGNSIALHQKAKKHQGRIKLEK